MAWEPLPDDARPFRLRVLDGLTDALKAIRIADGYSQDIGESVFRGRAYFGENDPLNMLSILEDPKLYEILMGPDATALHAGDWGLIVQGFVEDDLANPTDPAHFLLADAKLALARARTTGMGSRPYNLLGLNSKRVTNLGWGGGCVRPPDEISMKAYFWLPVTVHLAEDDAAPFTPA